MENAVRYARNFDPINDEKLNALAAEIKAEVHNDCYLADLIVRGVAYHVGYLPANIRLRIERSFENGGLRTIFCTSTLIEGVNLPADNLFITSYRNGPSNMDEVEFKNLIVNALLDCHDLALSCCREIARISVMECSL